MKTPNSSGTALAGKLCALAFALLPAAAWAECAKWDASGQLTLAQQNNVGKTEVRLDLRQAGDVITGKADTDRDGYNWYISGTVEGTVKGNKFALQIYWQYPGKHEKDEIGVYNGTIGPQGRLEGTAYIKQDPNNAARKSTWYCAKLLTCVTAAPATNTVPKPPPVPKPTKTIKTTGKPKLPPKSAIPDSADASGAAPAQGAPVITASPRTVSIPAGQSEGTTTLNWDGGSEHPYAEVWVKAGNEDETFVVEKGKGTRQVKVAAGKTYLYILTDSGKRLATVTVTGK